MHKTNNSLQTPPLLRSHLKHRGVGKLIHRSSFNLDPLFFLRLTKGNHEGGEWVGNRESDTLNALFCFDDSQKLLISFVGRSVIFWTVQVPRLIQLFHHRDSDDETSKARAMIQGIQDKMTVLLNEAILSVRDEPFTCRSLVKEGDPVQTVTLRLLNEADTLLVVESESRPERSVSPEAYTLLKEVTGVPILAL